MSKDLLLDSYDYQLDKTSIASRPASNRDNSKLLVYIKSEDRVVHTTFKDISKYIPEDSTLVMNRTKVFPCRLVGKKETGGKAEVFLLSLVPKNGSYAALIKMSRKKKVGDKIYFDNDLVCEIEELPVDDNVFRVSFNKEDLESIMYEVGKVPIPPYIRDGESDAKDLEDYQTVYAKEVGSVAAPTAGLHFTDDVFKDLEAKNIEKAFVTLHVGLGTFLPVKVDNILEHKMHTEQYFVDPENLLKINKNKKRFAVGTTSLRVLESSSKGDKTLQIEPNKIYKTDIFLYPGVDVHSIDGLLTNFHLPKSTLMMLVSSLIGREKCLELYNTARDLNYRFFSYGDAMLIIR